MLQYPLTMFSRPTIARIAIGILLGVVLGVVLHESNTRQSPVSFKGDITTSAYYISSYSSACAMGTAWSHGGCGIGCTEVPQVWPDCPGGIATLEECNAMYQSSCSMSSSYSSSVYCCYGYGQPNNCVTAAPGACGENSTEYADDLSCMDSCGIEPSSSSEYSSDSSEYSSDSSESSSENYCCNVVTGSCETVVPASAPPL